MAISLLSKINILQNCNNTWGKIGAKIKQLLKEKFFATIKEALTLTAPRLNPFSTFPYIGHVPMDALVCGTYPTQSL